MVSQRLPDRIRLFTTEEEVMTQFNWRLVLAEHAWEEGKVIKVVDGSYRTRVVVTCYSVGRQKAEFANGVHNYGAYVELTRPDGTWISQGMGIVPVLPDGRLIMVVEQRPSQFRLPNQPTTIMVGGETVDLREFGPYSSLEFPGGAVDPQDHTLKAGFLKELVEETEVPNQMATVYRRKPPLFPQGSDLALEGQLCVVYLTNLGFQKRVKTDGGLDVMALSPADVQSNIWAGNIRSAQAALLGWAFYREVEWARSDRVVCHGMLVSGYFEVLKVNISK